MGRGGGEKNKERSNDKPMDIQIINQVRRTKLTGDEEGIHKDPSKLESCLKKDGKESKGKGNWE